MSEVVPDDRSGILRLKRAECSSIATSRKRKLREFYAVATERDAIPSRSCKAADAPTTTTRESQFLLESDILQGRKLDDLKLPTHEQRDSDFILRSRRFLTVSTTAVAENATNLPSTSTREEGAALPTPFAPAAQEPSNIPRGPKAGHISVQALKDDALTSGLVASPQDSAQEQSRVASTGPTSKGDGRKPGHSLPPTSEHLAIDAADDNVNSSVASVAPKTKTGGFPPGSSSKVTTAAKFNALDRANDASSGSDSVSGALQPHQVSGGQDAMDADDSAAQGSRKSPGLLSIRLPPSDSSKATDVLSSPGSTAQTATTPAVHEASTDTSPDNDGLQYGEPDRDEDKQDDEAPSSCPTEQGTTSAYGANHLNCPLSSDDAQTLAKHGVEAQLLEESAAARAAEVDQLAVGLDAFPPQTASNPSPVAAEPRSKYPEKAAAEQSSGSPPLPEPSDRMMSSAQENRETHESSPPEPLVVDASHDQTATNAVKIQPSALADPTDPQGPQGHAASANATAQADKAITRMSSGAIRQKSVSEILGGGRKPSPAEPLPLPADARRQRPASGSISRPGKEKGKKPNAPTVVFGQQHKRNPDKTVITHSDSQSENPLSLDYLAPLFVQNYSHQSKKMKSMDQLLHQAYKTVSTPDVQHAMLENQTCRVLRRVYALQQQDKWALRQPSRCPEPPRPPSHWDVLLKEMKWMRTDFREERKWKQAVARNLAAACALWVCCNPEQRKGLQVNSAIPPTIPSLDEDIAMVDGVDGEAKGNRATPVPDLVPSDTVKSPADPDDDRDEFQSTIAPSAIFALQEDDVVFGLQRSAASDQLLAQLPIYGSPLKVPGVDVFGPDGDPDSHWRRPALPLIKFVEGQVVLAFHGPPCKRSRYQFEDEEGDEGSEEVVFGTAPNKPAVLERENKDVALFSPEMKAVRDRLHAGHQFRPPIEHPMPLQSFYECRPASQWTWAEDDQLKALVREYSYNWSLISSMVTNKSLFSSGAERRTPWECFERWVHLEGLPNDMSKTQYFRTYQNRIDAAQRVIQEQNQKVPQANPNGTLSAVQRKRPTTTVRVERRRNQKHLALIDSMRKLAKRREAAIQKQQYAATMRKASDAPQQRGPVKTPKEYSAMRFERDQQMAERVAQFAQRQSDAQRRQLMTRSQGQAAAVAGGSTPVPPQVAAQMAVNPLAGAARANVPSQLAVPGQPHPRMPMQAPPNAMAGLPAHLAGGLVPPMPINGIPQAQMQAMQAQHRMQMPNSQPDLQLVLQARRIQDQQRQAVQAQQQQAQQHAQQQGHQPPQLPGPQGPPGIQNVQVSPTGMRTVVNGMNQHNFVANAQAAALAAFNAPGAPGMAPVGGVLNMPVMPLGSPQVNSAQSPQMASMSPVMMGHLLDIETAVKAKHPHLTPDQVRRAALGQYQSMVNRQRQNAMTAASGGSPQHTLVNAMTSSSSPHQYAQLLRAQQHAQQQNAAQAAAAQHTPQHLRQHSSSGASMSK